MLASGLAVGRMLRQRLFTDEAMIGKRPQHDLANLPLRSEIRLGNEIARSLVRHAKPADPVEEHAATRAGSSLTDPECIGGNRRLHGGLASEIFW